MIAHHNQKNVQSSPFFFRLFDVRATAGFLDLMFVQKVINKGGRNRFHTLMNLFDFFCNEI